MSSSPTTSKQARRSAEPPASAPDVADDVDRKIVAELQVHGPVSWTEIAERVGLSVLTAGASAWVSFSASPSSACPPICTKALDIRCGMHRQGCAVSRDAVSQDTLGVGIVTGDVGGSSLLDLSELSLPANGHVEPCSISQAIPWITSGSIGKRTSDAIAEGGRGRQARCPAWVCERDPGEVRQLVDPGERPGSAGSFVRGGIDCDVAVHRLALRSSPSTDLPPPW
ncbi:MAG: AsnC family protein [Actinomycetota bacterium]|nr:AsnC family protein [Actinomycetota bacterium]